MVEISHAPRELRGRNLCRNHTYSIHHFRTSNDRAVLNAARRCGCRTSRPTDPPATGAPSSAPLESSTMTSEPTHGVARVHGTWPINPLVSPPGENQRGSGLAEKRTKNSGVMIVSNTQRNQVHTHDKIKTPSTKAELLWPSTELPQKAGCRTSLFYKSKRIRWGALAEFVLDDAKRESC